MTTTVDALIDSTQKIGTFLLKDSSEEKANWGNSSSSKQKEHDFRGTNSQAKLETMQHSHLLPLSEIKKDIKLKLSRQ